MSTFPFLTAYNPPGTAEGTLDPLGRYQIADQLAVHLVPAVPERMRRIRLLTAMVVETINFEEARIPSRDFSARFAAPSRSSSPACSASSASEFLTVSCA